MNDDSLPPGSASARELVALRAIVEGTAHGTGDDFYGSLVRHLASVMGTEHAIVAEFVTPTRVRTLAYWSAGERAPNVEYDLPGTPCEDVARGNLCHHPTGVYKKFPTDLALVEMGI